MTDIYIVTTGEYSDFSIEAAFDDEEDCIDWCIDKWLESKLSTKTGSIWVYNEDVCTKNTKLSDIILGNKALWIDRMPTIMKEQIDSIKTEKETVKEDSKL